MTVLLATDALEEHLRGGGATELVREAAVAGRRVTASVLSRVELDGAGAVGLEALDVFVDWVPVDHVIAKRASEHARRWGGGAVACVVAATAERIDARLLTRRPEVFPMFPDLEPIS